MMKETQPSTPVRLGPCGRVFATALLATALTGAYAAGPPGDMPTPGRDVTAPPGGVTPSAARIYITTPGSSPNNIPDGTPAFAKVLDGTTYAVKKSVPLEERPHHFYKVPLQNKAYIAHFVGTSVVEVMDLKTNAIVKKIPVTEGPRHINFSDDYSVAYTANFDSNAVSAIDTATDTVLWTSSTGENPNYPTPFGDYVAAANYGGSSLTILDAATGALVTEIPVGDGPFDSKSSCDGGTLISANARSHDVSFINAETLVEEDRVSYMGPEATSTYDPSVTARANLRVAPDCRYLWVGFQEAGTFSVLDIETRELVSEVRTSGSGGGSDIIFFAHQGPAQGLAFATNRYSSHTTVVDPTPPFNVIKQIPAALGTHFVTFNEDWTKGYVSSRIAGEFSVYDMATLTEETRVPGFPLLDTANYVWNSRSNYYYWTEEGERR